MTDKTDAQIPQVVCRQGRQDRTVDLIFAECRLVPFEAKAPQPTPDVHHRALTLACCARAASGHAAAAPPSSEMNWRRLMLSMGSSPEPAMPAYRRLRMPRKRLKVLGVDLNRSESSRQPACPRLSLPPPALRERRHRGLACGLIAVRRLPFSVVPVGERPQPRRSLRSSNGLHDAADHDAVGDHIVIILAPFTGCTARRRTLEDQRGHGRSHRRALGRSRACLPASVIRTRVTWIARSPAITRSVVTLASPALISSTNRSLLKPCASRIAAVQPSGDAASNSSARRRSALRRGSSAISAMHWI